MAVKKCCIENCNSSSTRPEDIGVTYHKFPKETTLRGIWVSVTHYLHNNIDSFTYVCSRHFCKSDFQIYQDSKYVLKSDAVPSIFSWTVKNKPEIKMDSQNTSEDLNCEVTDSSVPTRKMSGGESLEAIRRYIETQEREIEELENQKNNVAIKTEPSRDKEFNESDFNVPSKGTMDIIEQGDKVVMATNMIDMILNEGEVKKPNTKPKQLGPKDKGGSVSLSVGSKVEVKDFSESWYAANIIEVDYEEMEVLVHYDIICNKSDEWVSVNSPRLRPFKSISIPNPSATSDMEIKEDKQDNKTKYKYMIGERCLARWRDNRRFIATVCSDFGDGTYEVIFDDGAKWKCPISRLYKLKDSKSELTVDTSMSPTPSTPSPTLNEPGSSSSYPVMSPTIPFHKHLFDPTRDYLGSKSERREMKRKLNIKEIFNIGQKKQKRNQSPVDKVKVVKEKKPRAKKKVSIPIEDIKVEIKQEIPDAVASIIGTVDSENQEDELPKFPKEDETPKSPNNDEPSKSQEEDKLPKLLEEEELPKSLEKHEPSNLLKEDEPSKIPKQDEPPISPLLKIKEEVEEELLKKMPEVKKIKTEISQEMDIDEFEEVRVDPNEELIEEESMDTLVNNIMADDLVVPADLGFEKSKEFEQAVLEEETKLEKFDKPDESKQEVIEKMKEVINKLEDGLRVDSPKPELVIKLDKIKYDPIEQSVEKQKVKVKKSKKEKLQEKKVKKQVKKVASDLEEMKKQMEEMKKQMLISTELSLARPYEMPESYLLPGEWCCKWVNDQPVGIVSEVEVDAKDGKAVLPRRSVQVEDKRLPPGWTKHVVRRSLGQSVGKWDVVLVSPDNRRIHTKTDMKSYLEHLNDETLKPYEAVLLDFGVHLKLSRRMGWYQCDNTQTLPVDNNLSPLVINKRFRTHERRIKKSKKAKLAKNISLNEFPGTSLMEPETPIEVPLLEDGYVYVGSLKVQIIDTLLRCPAEGCFKNFRNNTLLQMHIKHYHPELREMLGATPKVLDLAQERTKPTDLEPKPRYEPESKIIKVKIARPPKRSEEPKQDKETVSEVHDMPITRPEGIPRSQDSPKLRQALAIKPVKRPKVLLPVRRPEPEPEPAPELPPELEVEPEQEEEINFDDIGLETSLTPDLEVLDFETAISTHTVTKPFEVSRKSEKKRRCISTVSKRPISEDDEWYGMNSDVETRSSFPGSGTPDSKTMDKPGQQIVSSESNEEPKDCDMYMFTETGERVKIEHMKREEIINCHCGFREEDGLMVQCELCLCWQHALCHNIQREAEVPEKYTCSICLNPRRGRRSKRFLHDQDRLYEGLLPGAKPCEILRRSHELTGNLLRLQDALHASRVKYYVATKKNHPKLYLWAKDWETSEIGVTQERLNSDYSDLNIVNNVGKENLPVVAEEVRESHLDIRTPITDEFSQRDGSFLGLNSGLSSLSGASLDLPITTSELERFARSVQGIQEISQNVMAPQPEAPIENSVCRERLLRHVQGSAALLDAKLDSFEALIVELESQDPSFEDDETADYFPRTKQTILMLMRDLETLEELAMIT